MMCAKVLTKIATFYYQNEENGQLIPETQVASKCFYDRLGKIPVTGGMAVVR